MSTHILELSEEIKDLLKTVRKKYIYARENDCFYNPNNYMWLFGRNTLNSLQCCFDPYTTFTGREEMADILREIRVEIDHFNPDGLRLFKEMK